MTEPLPTQRWAFCSVDWLVIAVLGVTTSFNRINTFDHFHNTDEYCHSTQAAYMEAEGLSSFGLVSNITWVTFLYRWAAILFGVYNIAPVRMFVLFLCWGKAVLLYRILLRETARWPAFLAAAFFTLYNQHLEGWSANREWFSGAFVLVGVWVAIRSLDENRFFFFAQRSGLFIAGACFAMGYCFKDQALPMSLIVPAFLVAQLTYERHTADFARRLTSYAIGYAVGLVLGYLPFFFAGTLAKQLQFTFWWVSHYAMESASTQLKTNRNPWNLFCSGYFLWLEYRGVIALGYLQVCLAFLSLAPKETPKAPKLPVLDTIAVLYLFSTMAAIQAGLRFFDHYYLFWLPPMTMLVGIALHNLVVWPSRFFTNFCRLFLFVPVWHELAFHREDAPMSIIFTLGAELILLGLCYTLTFVSQFRGSASEPRFSQTMKLFSRIGFHGAVLFALGALLLLPPPLPRSLTAERAAHTLKSLAKPTDRLFIWGNLPELYHFAGLTPASQFIVCCGIINGVQPDLAKCKLDEKAAQLLFRELDRTKPRFWVDVKDSEAYQLSRYPPIQEYIDRNYLPLGRLDGFDYFERRSDANPKP